MRAQVTDFLSRASHLRGLQIRGLAAGIGADLVVGGIVIGATGFAAHLNRGSTPAEWRAQRSTLLMGMGAVVAVDLASTVWVLTGLRTHALRTEHVAQPCSDWDTAPRTTPAPSVAVRGQTAWDSLAIEDRYAVFAVPADRLGRVLIPIRGPMPGPSPALAVIVQGPSRNSLSVPVPTYIYDTEFEPPWSTPLSISAETVAPAS